MHYRQLGRTGLRVSEIGFGGAPAGLPNYLAPWDPDLEASGQQVAEAIARAVALGVNYFDTAPGYGDGASERMFGVGLRPFRQQVTLATKFFAANAGDVRRSAEESLARLGVERIDVAAVPRHLVRRRERGAHPGPRRGAGGAAVLAARRPGALHRLHQRGRQRTGQPAGRHRRLRRAPGVLQPDLPAPLRPGAQGRPDLRGRGAGHGRGHHAPPHQRHLPQVAGRALPDIAAGDENQRRIRAALLAFVLSNPLVDCALVGMRTPAEAEENARTCEDDSLRLDLDWLHERYV